MKRIYIITILFTFHFLFLFTIVEGQVNLKNGQYVTLPVQDQEYSEPLWVLKGRQEPSQLPGEILKKLASYGYTVNKLSREYDIIFYVKEITPIAVIVKKEDSESFDKLLFHTKLLKFRFLFQEAEKGVIFLDWKKSYL